MPTAPRGLRTKKTATNKFLTTKSRREHTRPPGFFYTVFLYFTLYDFRFSSSFSLPATTLNSRVLYESSRNAALGSSTQITPFKSNAPTPEEGNNEHSANVAAPTAATTSVYTSMRR